jgi:hypothetical protein
MKSLIRLTALALFLLPVFVSAQEPAVHPLAGFWRGAMVEGATSDQEVIVELRIQGDVVNGPIFANGFERYIKQGGTVTANTIAFKSPGLATDADMNDTLVWTGQLTGTNEIAFSVVAENSDAPAREFVLTRGAVTGGR